MMKNKERYGIISVQYKYVVPSVGFIISCTRKKSLL